MPVGFCILPRRRAVSAADIDAFRAIPVANVSDCMARLSGCVPFDALAGVLQAAQAKQAAEVKQIAAIKAGTSDRSWVDETLRRLGCEIVDG